MATKVQYTKDSIFVEDGQAGIIFHHRGSLDDAPYGSDWYESHIRLPIDFEFDFDSNNGWIDGNEELVPVKPKITWFLDILDPDLHDLDFLYKRFGIDDQSTSEMFKISFYQPSGVPHHDPNARWLVWDFERDVAGIIPIISGDPVWTTCETPDEAVLRYLADSMIGV